MWFIHNPLRHLEAIRRWADSAAAQIELSARSWSLTVSQEARTCLLQPRFVVKHDSALAYTDRFEDLGTFVGWSPIGAPRWPLAQDKLAFKKSLSSAGLRAPAAWSSGHKPVTDFIIKPRAGSFGRDIRGPYRVQSVEATNPLPRDMYFEQFVDGRAAKAWCFGGQVAVLEVMQRPYLIGDGLRTVGEMAGARGSMDKPVHLGQAADMLAWQGIQTDTVVPRNEKVWLDYRYATPFDRPLPWDGNVWANTPAPVQRQFSQAAELLKAAIPETHREQAMFTLDAVIDQEDQVWFLEMNSHPMVHPGIYPLMLSGLFSTLSREQLPLGRRCRSADVPNAGTLPGRGPVP